MKKKLEFFLSSLILGNPKILIYASSVIAFLAFTFIVAASGITIFRLSAELDSGWASIIVSIFVSMSFNLISFGVIFFYLSRILNQVRARPRYVIDEIKSIKQND
jgi:dolichol-phosphate mannosyltransferase